jgi:hypothetical protein
MPVFNAESGDLDLGASSGGGFFGQLDVTLAGMSRSSSL